MEHDIYYEVFFVKDLQKEFSVSLKKCVIKYRITFV